MKDIVIQYQGVNCSSVNFSRGLGLNPDVGSVRIPVGDYTNFRIEPEEVDGIVEKLAQPEAGPRTSLEGDDRDPFPGRPGGNELKLKQFGDLRILRRTTDEAALQDITFSHTYISRNGIKVVKKSEVKDANGKIARYFEVELTDERRLWQDRGILDGDYNRIDKNGVKIGKNYFDPRSLNEGKLWTLKELISKAVGKLPSPVGTPYTVFRYNVSGQNNFDKITPLDFNNGGGRLAVQALGDLLDHYGLYLSLLLVPGSYGLSAVPPQIAGAGAKIVIVERGQIDQLGWEDKLLSKGYLEYNRQKEQPYFRPYGVRVTSSARVIKEYNVEDFVPVVQNPDSNNKEWISLEDNLDKFGINVVDLREQVLRLYTEKEKAFMEVKDEDARGILQEQAYKCFKMTLEDPTVLPMLRERFILEKGKIVSAPPLVTCDYFIPDENKDPAAALWSNVTLARLPGDKEPSFELEAGVIRFPDPIGQLVNSPSAKGAKKLSQVPGDPKDKRAQAKMEALRAWLKARGAVDPETGEKTGLEGSEGILDAVIAALSTGTDPNIPLEGAKVDTGNLISAVQDFLSSAFGTDAEENAKKGISQELGEIFKNSSMAPAAFNKYAESWRNLVQQGKNKAAQKGNSGLLFSLDECTFSPGRISCNFNYESSEYWFHEVGNKNNVGHYTVIEVDWTPIQVADFDNYDELDARAEERALEKFKGPDKVTAYEISAFSFWPIIADGDRPRVVWTGDAEGDFRGRTRYLWDDFISDLGGHPGIGEKERARRVGPDTLARKPEGGS